MLVISSTNGDMYVWMFLGNNAIAWNVLDKYLWHIKEAKQIIATWQRNPLTMRADKNLFLYLNYTPGHCPFAFCTKYYYSTAPIISNSSTGYVIERADNTGKCYSHLNRYE